MGSGYAHGRAVSFSLGLVGINSRVALFICRYVCFYTRITRRWIPYSYGTR